MNINDFKDLEKVLKLCRKHGVSTIEIDSIKISLDPAPEKDPTIQAEPLPGTDAKIQYDPFLIATGQQPSVKDTAKKVAAEELTEEQIMYYSTGANQ